MKYKVSTAFATKNSLGFRIEPHTFSGQALARAAGADAISVNYSHGSPSYPSDVMPEKNLTGYIAPVEGQEFYDVVASGNVDDQAFITIGGDSYESARGKNKPISRTFSGLKAGSHPVSIRHENMDYNPPSGNISHINCTLSPISAVDIIPDDNDPPEEETCDCPPCEGEDGEPTSGGDPDYPVSYRALGVGLRTSSFASSSGGRGASYESSIDKMTWSCRFGVFRGKSGVPAGRLEILAREFSPTLGLVESLSFRHPFATSLVMPEGGITPNALVMLCDGASYWNFMCDANGIVPFSVGASSSSLRRMDFTASLTRELSAACSLDDAIYVRCLQPNGSAIFYSKLTGLPEALMSASNEMMSAQDALSYLVVLRSDSGAIRQIWNYWDGLLDVNALPEGLGYVMSLYLPTQVSAPSQSGDLYTVTGDPFKTFTVRVNAELREVSMAEKDLTLPVNVEDFLTSWDDRDGAWSMVQGTGPAAIGTRRVRSDTQVPNQWQVRTTLSKGDQISSDNLEIYESTAVGDLLLSKTEAYGSELAETTTYVYDDAGRLYRTNLPDGGVLSTCYDRFGRMILESTPWVDNGYQIVETTYNDASGVYSSEPALVKTSLCKSSGAAVIRTDAYTYTITGGVKRTEVRSTAAASSHTQLSVTERWMSDAPDALSRGRLKMTQAINGVQTHYEYAPTESFGALYRILEETRVDGAPVPGLSTRKLSYVSAEGNEVRDESYVMLEDSSWVLIEGVSHEFDSQNRRIASHRDNGRSSSRALMCTGDMLWEIDENAVRTDYAYDSARTMIESTRAQTPVTPETIIDYVKDASGRVLVETTRIGAMETRRYFSYDLLGRMISSTDELGRSQTTHYAEHGLLVTRTLPTGATLITRYDLDGSIRHESGTGQRECYYDYDITNGRRRQTVYLSNHQTVLSQELRDGFGQVVTLTAPTSLDNTYIYTRSEYNALGQLTRTQEGNLAATLLEYDLMGNISKRTMLLKSSDPQSVTENRIVNTQTSFILQDGLIYQSLRNTRYNEIGVSLISYRKSLLSQTSTQYEARTIDENEMGLITVSETLYGASLIQREQCTLLPTSDTPAVVHLTDNYVVSQTDATGVSTTHTRAYRAEGMLITQTDGRGLTTTVHTDVAGRQIEMIDSAGARTLTQYDTHDDQIACRTNALGYTSRYTYDERSRKIAEYGTALQAKTFAYDEANRLIALTCFRVDERTIDTDPSGRTDGDTTRWTYHDTTGLLLSTTYADETQELRTYDAMNRLASVLNARGVRISYTYTAATGELIRISPDDGSIIQTYTYNPLGWLTQVVDASGTHQMTYDTYGRISGDSLRVNTTDFKLEEQYDALGRSSGYTLWRGTNAMHLVQTGYDAQGRISSASFRHAGEDKSFGFEYLGGSHLRSRLNMPNGMNVRHLYEVNRNLASHINDYRGDTGVSLREYTYDALNRPATRKYSRQGKVRNDVLSYNSRNELIGATIGADAYAYDFDNIGNRKSAAEQGEDWSYLSNELNQYARITQDGTAPAEPVIFTPQYDADGNQTLLETQTGIWSVTYDAFNRPIRFTSQDETIIIESNYDSMGRRVNKKVTQNGAVTLHQRYLYRGYLQIACIDMTRSGLNGMWMITWDPTQASATRPLALQKDATWYCYGTDLSKNVTEVYKNNGTIATAYTYAPFGQVVASGSTTQPLQWSSEYYDTELGLVYYNYRHYNPKDGRWINRDPIGIKGGYNLYAYVGNSAEWLWDVLGRELIECPITGMVRRLRSTGGCFEYRTKIPKKNYTPTSNGCGSDDIIGGVIPNSSFGASFKKDCNNHDICYGTCGKTKDSCDKMFYNDLMKTCHAIGFTNAVDVLLTIQCNDQAAIYYKAVVFAAGSAYQDAQSEACVWAPCRPPKNYPPRR